MDQILRDVDYFAVLAKHRHIGRAAEALGLGQPALSISLKRLERAVHSTLATRTAKGIELTRAGEALLSHVDKLRLARQDVLRELADLGAGAGGRLHVGASSMSADYLAAAYPKLIQAAPKLQLVIEESDNDLMIPAVMKGDLDLIFNYFSDASPDTLAHEQVSSEEWVVCCAQDNPLARRKRVRIDELVGARWALSPVNTLPENTLSRAFLDRGLPVPEIAVEARPVRIRLQLVAASALLTFTSRRMLQSAGPDSRIVEVRVPDLTIQRELWAIYRKAYLTPSARRLIDILKSRAAGAHRSRGPKGTD